MHTHLPRRVERTHGIIIRKYESVIAGVIRPWLCLPSVHDTCVIASRECVCRFSSGCNRCGVL